LICDYSNEIDELLWHCVALKTILKTVKNFNRIISIGFQGTIQGHLSVNSNGLPDSFDLDQQANPGWEFLESFVKFQFVGPSEVPDRDGLEWTVSFPGS